MADPSLPTGTPITPYHQPNPTYNSPTPNIPIAPNTLTPNDPPIMVLSDVMENGELTTHL